VNSESRLHLVARTRVSRARCTFIPSPSTGEGRVRVKSLRFFSVALNRVTSHARFAGGCPAASHFSCLAKKSNQKKARSTLALASAHDSPGAKQCFAKPPAHPLRRPSGSQNSTRIQSGQKNSLRSNSFWPKPSECALNFGGVEGRPVPRLTFKLGNNFDWLLRKFLILIRNIHEPFQPFLPQNPHKTCAIAVFLSA
jgi:hypothetical protein